MALRDGIITTRPDGPGSLLDLAPEHFMAFAEACLRSFGDEIGRELDELYEDARPTRPPAELYTDKWWSELDDFVTAFD